MNSNDTNKTEKIIYKELSYLITGILFEIHNKLGRFCREKQYGDILETFLNDRNISYEREKEIPVDKIDNQFTNRVDFVINNQLLIDLKAKDIITKEDYYQMNRYLDASGMKLGFIVNFRNKYLKPIRVIRANS
jgi:GxxExxY protein